MTCLVIVLHDAPFDGMESQALDRLFHQLLQPCSGLDIIRIEREDTRVLADFFPARGHDVFVLLLGSVLILPETLRALVSLVLARPDIALLSPRSNQARCSIQVYSPPVPYQTVAAYRHIVEACLHCHGDDIEGVEQLDPFCLGFRASHLAGLPPSTPMDRLAAELLSRSKALGIARGLYVHRYGDLYESPRGDLLEHIPACARRVLDVGCARGALGGLLKGVRDCTVVGIEPNPASARIARGRLDEVFEGTVEDFLERGFLLGETFDCIVCGDVLEHLVDPWSAVAGLRRHLAPGGGFVATVPNIGYWEILYEVLRGEWTCVPFTVLSGTHLRFFTRASLGTLFISSAFRVQTLEYRQRAERLPPFGEAFVQALVQAPPYPDLEALLSPELLIVARALSGEAWPDEEMDPLRP